MKSKSKNGELTSLGVSSPNSTVHHVEITLNLPQTTAYVNMLSYKQKNEYYKRYQHIFGMYSKYIYDSCYSYEFTKLGQVHLHAVWLVSPPPSYSVEGFVSDVSKSWLLSLTKKYRNYKPKCLYHNDDNVKYQCPSISVSYHINREDRFFYWVEYINKCAQ